MSEQQLTFDATIGVDVKGAVWPCVEIPGGVEFFGTGKSVRLDATVDEVRIENMGTLPTGTGGHMISLNAKVRKSLGKDVGATVHVTLARHSPTT